jgi:agmatine deiminase
VQPGPLYTTAAEAAGVDAAEGTKPREAGVRMAASYVNFYVGTRRIVVPLLDPKRDGAALRKLKGLFPGREIVGVPGREILLGGGNVHCIPQQVPAGRKRA